MPRFPAGRSPEPRAFPGLADEVKESVRPASNAPDAEGAPVNLRRLSLLAIALAFALGACSGGCKGKEPEAPATAIAFLPQQPQGLVHVPDLQKLGETAKALEGTKLAELAAAAAGAQDTEQIARPLVGQLGFDPRKPEGFAEAGIDGKRGLAVGTDEKGAQLLVIGVADAGRFDGYVARLAARFGAGTRGEGAYTGTPEVPVPAVKVTTFAGPDAAVKVGYAIRDGYAVIASDASAVEAVGRSISRPWAQSLANSPVYRKIAGKLGARDAYVWMPEGVKVRGRIAQGFDKGLALGVSAARTGVNVRALIPRGALELAVLQPAGKVAGGELVKLVPGNDFLAFRLGGEPQALQPILESVLPRGIFSRLRRAGIDPGAEVLSLLQPGVVVGIGLNPDIDLSGGLPQEASVSRTNPFDFVHAVVYAKVKDPAKAQAVLEKLAAGGDKFQMQVASEESEGAKIYKATYAAGEGMTWALLGDTLVATGGKGTFAKARARLANAGAENPFTVADPNAKKVFEGSASAAHLDMPKLAQALRAIPESAYGVGGFRLKAIVETWTGLLDEVKGITASFSVDDEGLVVDADLGLK